MMAWWADQEDEENDHFPNDKQGNGNGHFDKSQQNHSGNPRKRKPEQEVMAIEKVLHKQCVMHLKSRHMLFECVSLHKSLNSPPLPQAGKR
jgi:hypothetical protein